MGRAYKAQFSSSGAAYIPNLGPTAPQDYPVTLHLDSVDVGGVPIALASSVSAARVGDEVRYERGGLIERYSLRPDSIEQEFVLSSLPASGDLVLHLSVETELGASSTADGLRFASELGHVDYSRAVAIDAGGRRCDAETRLDGGSIAIRVSAEFLDEAALPLVIDPVISTFSINNSPGIDINPDVAFDASTGHYLVCWENAFSATDHDVWAETRDINGNSVPSGGGYIDFTTAYWSSPHVAQIWYSGYFLVAAEVGSAAPHAIWDRTRDTASANMGAQIQVSSEPGYDCINPVVGGNKNAPYPFIGLVVWERVYTSTDHDIHAQMIQGGFPYGGVTLIDNSAGTLDFDPSISKSNGDGIRSSPTWTITWTREYTAGVDYDIWGSQVDYQGTITHSSYVIDFSSNYDYNSMPSTILDFLNASGQRDYMVVYSELDTANSVQDVHARIFGGTSLQCDADLSALQGTAGRYTSDPVVDSDGSNYAVAYSERPVYLSTQTAVYVSTYTRIGDSIRDSEPHQLLDANPTTINTTPNIVSAWSGATMDSSSVRNHSMIVWDNYFGFGTDANISGGMYDFEALTSFCFPGVDASPCPCGNPPVANGHGCNNSSNTGGAILTGAGITDPHLAGVGSLVLTSSGETPHATSIFLQGNAVALPGAIFGQGVRCAAGTLKRLYVKQASGGVASAPDFASFDDAIVVRSEQLGDQIHLGTSRYYLVYYRDATVLGGCPASSTFNATQTLAVVWR
jgi:hypothetical protein